MAWHPLPGIPYALPRRAREWHFSSEVMKLHGKMLLADDSRAIVGSINLAPGSFDSRRKLAIEVHHSDVAKKLRKTARHDWKHENPLDLTDEGLLAEMTQQQVDAADELASRSGGEEAREEINRADRFGKYPAHTASMVARPVLVVCKQLAATSTPPVRCPPRR